MCCNGDKVSVLGPGGLCLRKQRLLSSQVVPTASPPPIAFDVLRFWSNEMTYLVKVLAVVAWQPKFDHLSPNRSRKTESAP